MGRGSLIKHAIPTCELHKGGLKKSNRGASEKEWGLPLHLSCYYHCGIPKQALGNQHKIVNCLAHLCSAQGTGALRRSHHASSSSLTDCLHIRFATEPMTLSDTPAFDATEATLVTDKACCLFPPHLYTFLSQIEVAQLAQRRINEQHTSCYMFSQNMVPLLLGYKFGPCWSRGRKVTQGVILMGPVTGVDRLRHGGG